MGTRSVTRQVTVTAKAAVTGQVPGKQQRMVQELPAPAACVGTQAKSLDSAWPTLATEAI